MTLLRYSTLALLALRATSVFAQVPADIPASEAEGVPVTAPKLAVKVSAAFPQSEIFGVKLVNGHPTQALLSFHNEENTPVNVAFVGGSLSAPDPATRGKSLRLVRNLTSTRFNVKIPPGEKESISYSFATELHPQDLRLNIIAILSNDLGNIYTMSAYNETVSVVEPDSSLFDPQLIFLYLMLLGLLAASVIFIYNTWITTLFPQKAKGGKGGERAKKSSGGSKRVDPSDQVSVVGADGPAVASAYDESWIPEHHINRPGSKRLKSGGGAGKPKKA